MDLVRATSENKHCTDITPKIFSERFASQRFNFSIEDHSDSLGILKHFDSAIKSSKFYYAHNEDVQFNNFKKRCENCQADLLGRHQRDAYYLQHTAYCQSIYWDSERAGISLCVRQKYRRRLPSQITVPHSIYARVSCMQNQYQPGLLLSMDAKLFSQNMLVLDIA